MKLTIIGLGLIGGSLAIDLKAKGYATQVIGVDMNPTHCQLALEKKLVDEIRPLEEAVQEADIVVLAIPVDGIVKLLPQVLDLVGPSATITDMGSTKKSVAEVVKNHPNRRRFVASHPMAGTEHSGPLAAQALLFQGRTAVICDRDSSDNESVELVEGIYQALGMRLVYMSSADHDLHVAYISHLSHISSFVLANTVLDIEKNEKAIFDLAGGGFESTVRLAKSSPEMWAPIFAQNSDHVIAALARYIHHLQTFQMALIDRDAEKIVTLMKSANEIRRVLKSILPSRPAGGVQ